MIPSALARKLAALALAASPLPTSRPLPVQTSLPNTERLETGEITAPGGDLLRYRIRLLPLASFPALPDAVVAQLSQRHCMIPQSFEARQPENVIRGSFRAPASSDWAVLCSAAGSTTLYVFFAGDFGAPVALRSQSDTAWLGAEPGSSLYGSAWGIAVLSASQLRSSSQLRPAASLDHDAIDDAHLEHSDIIRYFQNGKWLILTPVRN
jgi:hypothetical protein